MRHRRRPALAIAALTLAACGPSTPGSASPMPTPVAAPARAWVLAWSDEFDGEAGARVNADKWVADTGGHGWGNQERQYYTAGAENAALDGGGHLVITARAVTPDSSRRCWYGACRYTSARLLTKGRFETTYGRFEARIRIPRGQGLWPAFWMLGADIGSVGWPGSGEIDVMENIGREPAMVHGTLHGPGYSGDKGVTASYAPSNVPFADDFHVFAVEWAPGEIRWLVDGHEYRRTTPADLPAGA
jgi:beta-glucanase (GH16 family)